MSNKVLPLSPDAATGRRGFLTLLGALAGVAVVPRLISPSQAAAASPAPQEVEIEEFAASGKSTRIVRVPKVVHTEAEWRSQLSPLSFQVMRLEGTERAGTGEYAHSTGDGLYRCICCDTALYDSKTKYDSGTGWPSFWQPISAHNVVKKADYTFGIERDAISCRRCDAHLGHVFNDGPRPTFLRYCMNSVALKFVPRA